MPDKTPDKLISDLLKTLTPTGSRMDGNVKWQTSEKSQKIIRQMFDYERRSHERNI